MGSSGDLDSNNKIHCMLFEKKKCFYNSEFPFQLYFIITG